MEESRHSGALLLARAVGSANFLVDGAHRFGGNVHKLDADADAGQAVAHLAARFHHVVRAGEAEPELEHRAFGKMVRGVDEHASRTDVGRADGDVFAVALVDQREVAQMRKALAPRRTGERLRVAARAHFRTASSAARSWTATR